ncbi:FecCD family ABC transporter permease [Amycolatopsis anabasis]|uniref:FecCD family ABC transporter permease n=1 Tax=Amycolatopsis anabasis TaxID=1840409 RepID=UPI00131A97F0|nr:iron ABC transporter permease [Amycolatopsis anabasis]
MTVRPPILLPALGLLVVLLLVLGISLGAVDIPPLDVVRALTGQPTAQPSWAYLVTELRAPRALTALLAGAGLGVSGLVMQTLFRNALAEPNMLGIHAGASLGVGLIVLGGSGALAGALAGAGLGANLGLVAAAALGATAAMAFMLAVAAMIRSGVIVIILGVVLNAFVQAGVNLLVYLGDAEAVKTYTTWVVGSFERTTWRSMPVLALAVGLGLAVVFTGVKQLNLYLLGETYAESLGVPVRRFRWLMMLGAALLAGAVTAYSGPILFLGIAAPHLARGLLRAGDHRLLVPASALLGAAIALLAGIIGQLPGAELTLPINTSLAILGAPVVAWVLIRMGRSGRGLEV